MILFSILLAFFLLVGVLIASTKMDKRFQKKRPRIKNNNKFRINYFRKWFWPPKHHNLITTIVRFLTFLLGFIIIAIPYTILYTGFGVNGVPLTIVILWPGLYLIMYVIRKIKVGKHYNW